MDKETYPDAGFIRLTEQVVPLKLDTDRKENQPLAEKYRVSAIPNILFITPDGKVLGRFEGFLPPKQFGAELLKYVKKYHSMNSTSPHTERQNIHKS